MFFVRRPNRLSLPNSASKQQNGLKLRKERVYITLLRDHTGLGFSILEAKEAILTKMNPT